MLARKYLLSLKEEFPRLRKEGKIYDSPSFGLLLSYQAHGGPKAAFIISKKIDKRSTVRHRIKRQLAEAITSFLPRLPKNLELVFLAKQRASNTPPEEIAKEIAEILHRARLLEK